MDRRFFQRLALIAISLVTGFGLLVGPVLPAALAQTQDVPVPVQGGGLPVAVTANVPAAANSVYHNVLGEITKAVVVAFFNALQTFFGQIAYDAASYIAAGGKGQEAEFYKKGFGAYLADVGQSAAGDFIGTLSDSTFFRTLGVNLCQPKNPLSMLNIQLSLGNFFPGLNGAFTRPQPKCNFQDIVRNYDNLYQSMASTDIMKQISFNVNTNSSDLGVSVGVIDAFNLKVATQVSSQEKQRLEGGGFKAAESIISGNVRTPADVVRQGASEQLVHNPNASQLQMTGAILSNAFQEGPIQLAEYTASVFINTLASKLLKRVFDKGIDAVDITMQQVGGSQAVVTAGSTDVRNTNLDLKTPNLQSVATFEVMSEFVACPSTNRGLWNCTVDQPLARAVQSQGDSGGVTIKEAISKDYLHADWRLIPDTRTADNQNPQCYTYAYCAGNMEKLRLARILPVGFEFAANSPENVALCTSANGCVTLKEVVDGYFNCNTSGARDATHPWCHLIDPNWVITSIPQQCALSGYGDSLLSAELGQRKQECQDVQTCLQRNDHGQCIGGYGYCIADKSVYRFNADECPERYASCRTFTTRAGAQVSYERNTLDYAQCNANNVGCLWYATTRDPSGGRDDNWIGTTSTGPKIYFNSKMQSCAASNEGCTKLYAMSIGQPALNLVMNPSFERTGNAPVTLTSWLPSDRPYVPPAASTGTSAVDGFDSLYLTGSSPYTQGLDLAAGRTYTLSFYARATTTGITPTITVKAFQYKDQAETIPQGTSDLFVGTRSRYFISPNCTLTGDDAITFATTTLSTNWNRYDCTFASASGTASLQLQISGNQTLIDAVQLEEGEFATTFIDGLNTALPEVHMKIPPDDFACKGLSTDHPSCQKFARVCQQTEAGCQGYTDTAAQGPEIPAIVSTNDQCPNSCVGYAEYRKLPSAFDLVHDDDTRFDDPTDTTSTYFIPSTASQCTQADVGCEAFTNVEAAAAGGESTSYFNYVRSCEKPDAHSETFFTWEGSDVTGFQLRTWSLKVGSPLPPTPPTDLVLNGSFEGVTGGNYDTWRAPDTSPIPFVPTPVTGGSPSYDGTNALGTPTRGVILFAQQDVVLAASQTYTLSFYARSNDPSAGSMAAIATLYQYDSSHIVVSGTAYSSGCFTATGDVKIYHNAGLTTTWQRYECTFTSAASAASATLQVVANNTLIDSVSLLAAAPAAPVETGLGPRILAKKGPDQVTFKEPASCSESVWRSGLDPDCRQFYDAAGNIFYRYESQTVLSTPQCTTFRIARTDVADCEKTGGAYNGATGECDYGVFVPQSRTCGSQAVDCRAYAGAQAGNTQAIFTEHFRDATTTFTNGTFSDEALLVGDKSWRIDSPAGAAAATSRAFESDQNGLYRVTFWAKSPGAPSSITVSTADPSNPGLSRPIGNITLTSDWQRYSIGLFTGVSQTTSTLLTFTAASRPSAFVWFLDEVTVEKMQDVAYVRMNSWTTPIECDRTSAGSPEPQAMLGCREYTDRKGRTLDLRQFTRLCREQSIGCTGFVDTRNSDAVGSQTFVQKDDTPQTDFTASTTFSASTTTRPADRYVYLIDDPSKYCTSDNDSCRAFGKPTFSADRLYATSTTVYFKDDITNYGQALCKPSELFCDAFTYGAATDYFRDPQNHICDYRTNVHLGPTDVPGMSLADGNYDGWFQTGSSIPCYPSNLQSGHTFGILRRGDVGYRGWGALCPDSYAECTEFRDPNDHSDPQHRTGKPYFFIRNDQIDTRSCNGNVDVGQGCVLMRDMSDTQMSYNVAASYYAYSKNLFNPTAPVDCVTNPGDPSCMAIGHATSDDANLLVKVKVDRDCAQWLGCKSAETVLDPATSQYKSVCTNLALCDKASNQAGDIFCSEYVDRTSTSTEPILNQGGYFDINRYVSRQIGLGQKDYDGYAIPNAFQAMDLVSTQVGYQGWGGSGASTGMAAIANRFALDYRLAAAVKTPPIDGSGNYLRPPRGDESILLTATTVGPSGGYNHRSDITASDQNLVDAHASFLLCRHLGSGRIGYFSYSEYNTAINLAARNPVGVTCYLPVNADPGTDTFDFQNLSDKFQLTDPKLDPMLSRAFPDAECRAYPEADSPFPTNFVTGWDTTVTPFKPSGKVSGYENANTCEYGEDCSCTYKRAQYTGANVSKFYGLFAQNILPGICAGGPRDGQSCLPNTVYQPPTSLNPNSTSTEAQAVTQSNLNVTCGPAETGARCVALDKISIVRGIFGQCLERDTTRNIGADLSQHPCLTWNPTPILFGEKDFYHYNPTAGYLPPDSSGQYYCASRAKAPTSEVLSDTDFLRFDPANAANQAVDPANSNNAQMPFAGSMFMFHFNPQFVAEHRQNWAVGVIEGLLNPLGWLFAATGWGGDTGAHLLGLSPNGSLVAQNCADGLPSFLGSGGGGAVDTHALRLISAGRDTNHSYAETFFAANDASLAQWVFHTSSTVTPSQAKTALFDSNFSYFDVKPATAPERQSYMGCLHQPDWVDSLGDFSYGDSGQMIQADKEWTQKFNADFTPVMTRSTEQLFSGPDGHPYVTPCVQGQAYHNGATGVATNEWSDQITGPTATDGAGCYMKTWELDYHIDKGDNANKFTGLFPYGSNGQPQLDQPPVGSLQDIRRSPAYRQCSSDKPYFAIRAVFQVSAKDQADRTTLDQNNISGPWRFVGFWVSTCAGSAGDDRFIYAHVTAYNADVCRELAEVRSKDSHQDAAFTDRVWKESTFNVPQLGLQYNARYAPFASALNSGPVGSQPLFMTNSAAVGFSPLKPPTFLGAPTASYYRNGPFPKDKWAYLSNLFARIYRIYLWSDSSVGPTDNVCQSGPLLGKRCGRPSDCSAQGQCSAVRLINLDPGQGICDVTSGINAGSPCDPSRPKNQDICYQGALAEQSDGSLAPALTVCGCPGGAPTCAAGSNVCGANSTRAGASCTHVGAQSLDCPVQVWGHCDLSTHLCQDGTVPGGHGGIGQVGLNRYRAPCENDYDCSFTGNGNDVAVPQAVPVNTLSSGSHNAKYADRANRTDVGGMRGDTESACMPVSSYAYTYNSSDPSSLCNDTELLNNPLACTSGNASTPGPLYRGVLGRCQGGVLDDNLCIGQGTAPISDVASTTSPYSCGVQTGALPACAPANTPGNCIVHGKNICEHQAGYYPDPSICPNPDDEYCGLIAYQLNDTGPGWHSLDPNATGPSNRLPTDVTIGHYTPYYLGFRTGAANEIANYNYAAYYTPRPPAMAAPDTRNCSAPGQCAIQTLDTFAFDGQSNGPIDVPGGQHKSTIQFYGWAAHEQMPLRELTIDWGDGNIQDIQDARLKNHKPFCAGQKECYQPGKGFNGLSCNTDTDCPPGAGLCQSMGSCSRNANIICRTNADCTVGGVPDTCTPRTFFGNSTDACQTNYFDFSHVYACSGPGTMPSCSAVPGGSTRFVPANTCYFGTGDSAAGSLDIAGTACTGSDVSTCNAAWAAAGAGPLPTGITCGPPPVGVGTVTSGRCSRDTARLCSTSADCAIGDTCVANGLAPPGGCWDATANTCRFTPRVMLIDNWGWCTGECRNTISGGVLTDTANSPVRHPFGGCWSDATQGSTPNIRDNTAGSRNSLLDPGTWREIVQGECAQVNPQNVSGAQYARPWVVYPGALNLRSSGALAAP